MYERIMVPLDGSALAEQALTPATDLAAVLQAPLHLVRVVDRRSAARVDTYALGLLGPAPASLIDEERAAAEAYLATMRDRCAARGLVATSEVRLGVPADEILAATHPADLLVLASHGRSGLTRWLLGSTAEAVVRQATGSVLLIRATAASLRTEGEAPPARRSAS